MYRQHVDLCQFRSSVLRANLQIANRLHGATHAFETDEPYVIGMKAFLAPGTDGVQPVAHIADAVLGRMETTKGRIRRARTGLTKPQRYAAPPSHGGANLR